jgi:hypothetical protein
MLAFLNTIATIIGWVILAPVLLVIGVWFAGIAAQVVRGLRGA